MDRIASSEDVDARLIMIARRQFEDADVRARRAFAGNRAGALADAPPPAPFIDAEDFDGYEIVEEIHRGGQGVVYRGVQLSTRREVAIKVLRGGRSATARERFRLEREARVLAQLRHPNVVPIYDSGVTGGHAYLVMDYIAGRPLDEFVRARRDGLTVPTLLRLFATICDAVHAAHVRGITHRDLKPANIRVDEQDEPHVLDFGLAKLIERDSDAGSSALVMTQTGQFVGSLPWAAPEQVSGLSDAIDLRTDVYSLGVILYQLLTERFPYPLTGNTRDMFDHILRTEPVTPRSIVRGIPEDVETIVLKCLQKAPDRRYQTAGELARDVRRYLEDKPIDARRDSLGYLLRKHLRRRKLSVAVAGAFVLVVVGGFATSAVLWQRAVNDRNAAQSARDNESEQRGLAEASATRAGVEAAKAEAVTSFLTRMLRSSDPAQTQGRDVTVREVLNDAAARIDEGELANEPDVLAEVQLTIAAAYESLGRYQDAERMILNVRRLIDERLGSEHPLMLRARTGLANVYFRQGRYADAETAYKALLEENEQSAGPDDPSVLAVTQSLGFSLIEQDKPLEAETILRPAYARATDALGPRRLTTLKLADTLAIAARDLGDPIEAQGLHESALEGLRATLGDDHPTTLAVMTNLGVALRAQRRFSEAEEWLRLAADGCLRVMGEDHPQTGVTLSNLSMVLWFSDQADEAEEVARRVISILRRTLAPGHPKTLKAENNLARSLRDQRKFDELAALLEELVTARRRDLGMTHPETIRAVDYRRDILHTLDRQDELRAFMNDVLTRWRAAAQQEDASPDVLIRYASLRLTCEPEDLRDPPAAVDAARRAVELDDSADSYDVLAQAYQAVGDFANAIEAQNTALARLSPDDERRRVLLEEGMAELLGNDGDLADAEQWLREMLVRRLEVSPEGGSDVEIALELLGRNLLEQGELVQAEAVVRECLERRQERIHAGHALIALTNSLYGEVLMRQGLFEAAEPLLLESFARVRDDPQVSQSRRSEARRRIVDLYEAWGRDDDAAIWRDSGTP